MNILFFRKIKVTFIALLIGGSLFPAVGPLDPIRAAAGTPTPTPTFPALTAREFPVRDYAESVAFSPDGKYVLTGDAFGSMTLWDAVTGNNLRTFLGAGGIMWRVAFSPDGKYVLVAQGLSAEVWQTAAGTHVATVYGIANDSFIDDAAFSPDGKEVLISGGRHDTAILYRTSNGQRLRVFNSNTAPLSGHVGQVMSVAFSPDGQSVAAGGDNNVVWLWDVNTGTLRQTFKGHLDVVRSLAFSPDGKYLLTGSFDNTAQLWAIASGTSVRTFSGHLGAIFSAVFSPDGKYVLTGSQDRTAILWDAATGSIIHTYFGPTAQVDSVAFSPNGQYILMGSEDSTARLRIVDTTRPPSVMSVVTALPEVGRVGSYNTLDKGAYLTELFGPGAAFANVSVTADETRAWTSGWCAKDAATVQANWKDISQRFLINNIPVPASQIVEYSSKNNGLFCITQVTLLSGWKSGEIYTFTNEQIYSADIDDGINRYAPGKYDFVFYATVQ